jgi:hypothetical protein
VSLSDHRQKRGSKDRLQMLTGVGFLMRGSRSILIGNSATSGPCWRLLDSTLVTMAFGRPSVPPQPIVTERFGVSRKMVHPTSVEVGKCHSG